MLVAVRLAVDVPVELAVDVLVAVELAVALAEVVPPLVEAVAEDEDVAVELAVAVDVPVAEAVEVDVDVPVAVDVGVGTAAPVRTSTSQRYVVAVSDTEISDRLSPASAKLAYPTSDAFNPFSEVTVTSPPPSVFIRRIKRIPGLVGLASTRVSLEAPLVSSHISRSALARIVPPLPGSAMSFGPL